MIITHGFYFLHLPLPPFAFDLKNEQQLLRVLTFAFDLEMNFCLFACCLLPVARCPTALERGAVLFLFEDLLASASRQRLKLRTLLLPW
jgi:hypothetical protein